MDNDDKDKLSEGRLADEQMSTSSHEKDKEQKGCCKKCCIIFCKVLVIIFLTPIALAIAVVALVLAIIILPFVCLSPCCAPCLLALEEFLAWSAKQPFYLMDWVRRLGTDDDDDDEDEENETTDKMEKGEVTSKDHKQYGST